MPYTSNECKKIAMQLSELMRVMMPGKTHKYNEHNNTYTCMTNEQVFKHWRIAPTALEFRIRRLRMLQECLRQPSQHIQVNAAMFGKLIFESDQLDEYDRPHVDAHSWLHMFAEDVEALNTFDEETSLHRYIYWHTNAHT